MAPTPTASKATAATTRSSAAAANDHAEGNDGDDTIFGEGGNDDLIGGSDKAGVADVGRDADLRWRGPGRHRRRQRRSSSAGGYVLGRTVTLLDPGIGGGDIIEGDADKDAAFGEVGNDVMWGDHGTVGPFTGAAAPDYLEGDNGDDTIRARPATDDIVGGSSANDGVIDADRVGTALPDGGETLLDGGAGEDWIAGDNARMDRVLGNGLDYPDPSVTPIMLFDLAKVARRPPPARSAATSITGGDADRPDLRPGRQRHPQRRRRRRLRRGQQRQRRHRRRRRRRRPHRWRLRQRRRHRRRPRRQHAARRRRDVGQRRHRRRLDHRRQRRSSTATCPSPQRSVGRRSSCSTSRRPAVLRSRRPSAAATCCTATTGNDRIFGQGNGAQPATQTDPADGATTTSSARLRHPPTSTGRPAHGRRGRRRMAR